MNPQLIWNIIAMLIVQVGNAAAGPVAKVLASVLPDVTEDALASFLHAMATELEQVNP